MGDLPSGQGGRLHTRPAHPRGHRRRLLAEGMTAEDILVAYPDLEAGDIREALE